MSGKISRMKLHVLAISLLVAVMLPVSGTAAAADSIKVMVDGVEIDFPDGKPFADESGRIQVPIRFIAEALGIDVSWNEETKTVGFSRTYEYDGVISQFWVTMTVGQDWFDMYGESFEMGTTPMVRDGRIYAPLRFVAVAFNIGVKWDGDTKTVHLGGEPEEFPLQVKRFD